MDFWPTGYSQHSTPRKKGKKGSDAAGKTAADSGSGAYPIVEQGSVAAANLIRQGRRVEWTYLGLNDTGRRLRAHRPPTKIFPATYPKVPAVATLNVTHKAEQGAQFLRTHYPDVDIASDVIRAELTEDARHASESLEMDPFDGNKLAFLTRTERTRRKAAYLAFPVGPTGRDLNLSQLTYSTRDYVTFRPSAKVIKTFDTPIDQIVGYHSDTPDALQGTYMAVRTVGSTHLTQLQWEGGTAEETSIDVLATWTRSQTGQGHIVDVLLPTLTTGRFTSIIAVTDQGQIYNCFADSQRSTHLMYAPPANVPNDKFWRIIRTSSEDALLLLSSSTLSMIDFRSKSESLKLLTTTHEPLTDAEVPGTDHMIRALTVSDIIWFDERFPKTPLIGYKHGRQKDRTLRLQTMSFSGGPLTFLTSSRSNLVTIYDVTQDGQGVVHMNTPAYSLPPFEIEGESVAGSALIRHPSDTNDDKALFLRLSDRGSIHRLDLTVSEPEENIDVDSTHAWSEEVQQLAERSKNLDPEYGQLGGRTYSVIDLEQPTQRIFALNSDSMEDSGEAVYNTLDAMRSFWSTLDEPVDNMLTASDVVFRCGQEPDAPSRTDFFTGNELNSRRGFRALRQNRIPLEQVARDAPWHYDIHPYVSRLLPELCPSPEDTFDALSSHDLQMDDYRTGPSIRREGEAREQLTLDLALSTDVYAPNPIKRNPDLSGNADDDAFETMSRATEAMSIGVPEPPPVQFGFLRPDFSKGSDHYAEEKEHERKPEQPLGVRLLLKDWEIGSDPESYMYYDPYDISGIAAPRPIRPTRLPPVHEAALRPTQQTQSQKAPPVIASSIPMVPPPILSSQPPRALPKANWQSQDVVMAAPRMGSQPDAYVSQDGSQSQEMFIPSTQVLPGPFGGRPAAKKKPAKKRLGGF